MVDKKCPSCKQNVKIEEEVLKNRWVKCPSCKSHSKSVYWESKN